MADDANTAPSRLAGIDALRAGAALWVVLFHLRAFSGRNVGVPGLDLVIRSGSTGVSLFLVLSGFCLFLPFAGGRTSKFSSRTFFRRRCRRLLPAYYASLAIIAIAAVIANGRVGLPSRAGLGGQVLAHATLTHPLFPGTFYGLNGAYWSLGLEWELYLTMPLIILAVRRFGVGRTVATLVVVNAAYRLGLALAIAHGMAAKDGAMATTVLPNLFIGRWGEFAVGVLAAELYASGRAAAWGRRLQWVALAVVPVGLVANESPLSHLLFGFVFFTAVCMVAGACRPVVSIASWRPLVVIGVMSYSLYLVHQPLVEMGGAILGAGRGVSPSTVFLELLVLSPLLLVAAWLLFMAVERRTVDPGSMAMLRRYRLLVPRRNVGGVSVSLPEGAGS